MKWPAANGFILFPLFVGLVVSGQTNSQDPLADTLQWLRDSTAKQTNKTGGTKFTFRTKGPYGCSVVLEEHFEADQSGRSERTEKIIFSLADIDPGSIHVGGSRPTDQAQAKPLKPSPDEVWFATTNNVKTIIRGEDPFPGDIRSAVAVAINEEFAPKFVVRLRRAAELCKAFPPDQTVAKLSLADTLRWLTDTTSIQSTDSGKASYTLKSEGPSGCSLALEQHFHDGENPDSSRTISFSLAELDSDSIHVGGSQHPIEPGLANYQSPNFVLFHTTNYNQSIVQTSSSYPANHRGDLILQFDAEFASDFVLRLKHAVELCGGKKTSSPLPNFVLQFDMPTATSGPIPSSQPLTDANIDTKSYEVVPRLNYRLCKEVSSDVRLEGGSFFQRTEAGGTLLYVVGTYPDSVFRKTSTATAHIEILEVPTESADTNCPSLETAFPTVVQKGPAHGWSSMWRYIENGVNPLNFTQDSGGMATNRGVDVSAKTGTDDVYCTHKFVLGSMVGETSYNLVSWTPTRMEMSITARQIGGGPGAHASITLYVKYIPRAEREKFGDKQGCTAMPPAWTANITTMSNHAPLSIKNLPDGSFMYEAVP